MADIKFTLHFCGMALTGKSTMIQKLSKDSRYHVYYTDYFENCEHTPVFKDKSDQGIIQILYTIHMASFRSVQKEDKENIQDRSVLSDIFYELVFAEMKDKTGISKLDSLMKVPLFCNIFRGFNVLFFIAKPDCHELVLEKMKARGNGIDILSLEYVQAQWKIFTQLKTLGFTNFCFLDFSKHELFTKKQEEIVLKEVTSIFEEIKQRDKDGR